MKNLCTLLSLPSYSFKKEDWEYFIKATSCFFVCLPHPHSLFCDVIRMRPIWDYPPLAPQDPSHSEYLNQWGQINCLLKHYLPQINRNFLKYFVSMSCHPWYQSPERILRLINRRRIPGVFSAHIIPSHTFPQPTPLRARLRMSHILGGSLIRLSSIWAIITKGIEADAFWVLCVALFDPLCLCFLQSSLSLFAPVFCCLVSVSSHYRTSHPEAPECWR